MSDKPIRVLLGSPIHQKAPVLQQFLESLRRLKLEGTTLDFFFIDDNQDEQSAELLKAFQASRDNVLIQPSGYNDAYIRNDTTHFWHTNLVWKVAAFKNLMIQRAQILDYDYLFLLDSDLILYPDTLKHLIGTNKDIISEVFWTQWQPGTMLQPQVWMHDEYNQWDMLPGEKPSAEEINRRFYEFIAKMQNPGIYEVGGLGACTLISRAAIAKGVSYSPVKNISFWGEDRHFCIRAAALGIGLFVDTHYPALHLYRDSDLDKVDEFVARTSETVNVRSGNEPEQASPPEGSTEAGDSIRQGNSAEPGDSTGQEDSTGLGSSYTLEESIGTEGSAGLVDSTDMKSTARPEGYTSTEGSAGSGGSSRSRSQDSVEPGNSREPEGSDGSEQILPSDTSADTVPVKRPKLTLAMIVKNEANRFLRQVLEEHRKYIDEAVIIDDGSTDNSADICREVLEGIPLQLVRNTESKFSNEYELRTQLWEEVIKTEPEWILALDADEVFENRFTNEIDGLLRDPHCDLLCFRLYDFWDEQHYREDIYWSAHLSYRPFLLRYNKDFPYTWNKSLQHCGRLPENIFEVPHQLSNLRIKHLGWSRPEFRLEKFARYMHLDPDGQFGWKEQYISILDQQPHLVPWVE